MELSDISIGMTEFISHVVTQNDIQEFAQLSGDINPIHIDEEYAKSSVFGKRIAHGLFTASFFSGIFGTKLPGKGSLYISQNLRFKKPVFVDDRVEIRVTVQSINLRKRTVLFSTTCSVLGVIVTQGAAEIYVPKT